MLTGARLSEWAELDRQRRGVGTGGLARLASGFPLAALAGLAAAGALVWLARRSGPGEGVGDARTAWAVVAGFACAGIVMRAPFRMYWRADATLLARLPIPGDALYGLALRRSLRAAVQVGLALVIAAAAVAILADDPVAILRYAAVVAGACTAAALLTPPVGALAGALIANDKLQRGLASMAGESGGPPLVWLSFLPAVGGLAAGGVLWFAAPWAHTGATAELPLAAGCVGGALAVAALLGLAARRQLASLLPAATREVAALDAVKLATLQLDTARGLEAAWGRLAAGSGLGGMIYRKDVALSRRRHPMFFLLAGLGLLILWLLAAFGAPLTRERWALAIGVGLAIYLAVFGRRLAREPIERPRLLDTLPLPPNQVTRAKWAFVLWRAIFIVIALAPCVARVADPGGLAAQLGAILVVATVIAGGSARAS